MKILLNENSDYAASRWDASFPYLIGEFMS
jgi:hypothetical protein